TVRKRGDTWMLDIRHKHDGRVTRFRIACPKHITSSRAAEAHERKVLADLLAGIDPRAQQREVETRVTTSAPTIDDYVAHYISLREADGLKPSTIVAMRGLLATWIIPTLGERRLDAIRTADYSELRIRMLTAVTPKTTNNGLVVLSTMVRRWHAEHDLPTP